MSSVRLRIREFFTKQVECSYHPRLLEIGYALAEYDFRCAPSNWDVAYHHEETIFGWAKWVETEDDGLNNRYVGEYTASEGILLSYRAGRMHDCFDLLVDYFE